MLVLGLQHCSIRARPLTHTQAYEHNVLYCIYVGDEATATGERMAADRSNKFSRHETMEEVRHGKLENGGKKVINELCSMRQYHRILCVCIMYARPPFIHGIVLRCCGCLLIFQLFPIARAESCTEKSTVTRDADKRPHERK